MRQRHGKKWPINSLIFMAGICFSHFKLISLPMYACTHSTQTYHYYFISMIEKKYWNWKITSMKWIAGESVKNVAAAAMFLIIDFCASKWTNSCVFRRGKNYCTVCRPIRWATCWARWTRARCSALHKSLRKSWPMHDTTDGILERNE